MTKSFSIDALLKSSKTIREQIISSIVSELADIKTANGYETNIGNTVKRGIRIVDRDRLPGVAIFAHVETNAPLSGKHNLKMPIRLEALADSGSVNPSIMAERMLGDLIKKAESLTVSKKNSTSGLAESIQYLEGGIEDYPEPGQQLIGVSAIFTVNYKTINGDPYSQ